MVNRQHEFSNKLSELLKQQIAVYSQAEPVAVALADTYDLTPGSQHRLEQLNELIRDASQRDEEILLVKSRLVESNIQINDEIKAISSELAQLIRRVMNAFDTIEKKAIAAREQFSPKLTQQIKIQKMQAAYDNPGTHDI